MKISVLTATYNRENLLKRLYTSILKNCQYNVEVEWIIMNDGSTDNTKKVINEYIKEGKITIKYYEQENKGKMQSINNIMQYVTGDVIIECDSDDYFVDNAFELIDKAYQESKDENYLYALCFLKYDQNNNNIGKNFKNKITTMFDLYFKEGEDGEKALVYFADKRVKYSYELEGNERFVTEARMHHKMDLKYKIKCYNFPIMICEYQKDGYTKNIMEVFKRNPKGYYEYFREILEMNLLGVRFNKLMYIYKHYILFSILSKKKGIKNAPGFINKVIVAIMWIPGLIKTKKKF